MMWKRRPTYTRLLAADVALMYAACAAAYVLRFHGYVAQRLPYRGEMHPLTHNAFVALCLAVFWALAADYLQVHTGLGRRSFPAHMWAVFRAFSWSFIVIALVNMFLLSDVFNRSFLAFVYPLGLILLSGAHTLAWLLRKPPREACVLIVGEGRPAERAVVALRALPAGEAHIAGTIGPRPVADLARLGPYEELCDWIAPAEADTVVLALPAAEHHRVEGLIAALSDRHVAVQIVPDLPEPGRRLIEAEVVNGVPFIQVRGRRPKPDFEELIRRGPPDSEETRGPPAGD